MDAFPKTIWPSLANDRVGDLIATAAPGFVVDEDGRTLVFANAAGLRLLDADATAFGRPLAVDSRIADRLARFTAIARPGDTTRELLRLFDGLRPKLVTLDLARTAGERAVFVATFDAARAGPGDVAESLAALAGADGLAVVFDATGDVRGAAGDLTRVDGLQDEIEALFEGADAAVTLSRLGPAGARRDVALVRLGRGPDAASLLHIAPAADEAEAPDAAPAAETIPPVVIAEPVSTAPVVAPEILAPEPEDELAAPVATTVEAAIAAPHAVVDRPAPPASRDESDDTSGYDDAMLFLAPGFGFEDAIEAGPRSAVADETVPVEADAASHAPDDAPLAAEAPSATTETLVAVAEAPLSAAALPSDATIAETPVAEALPAAPTILHDDTEPSAAAEPDAAIAVATPPGTEATIVVDPAPADEPLPLPATAEDEAATLPSEAAITIATVVAEADVRPTIVTIADRAEPQDRPEPVAEAPAEVAVPAPLAAEAVAAPVADRPAEPDFAFRPLERPVKFVWQMDAERRFTLVSDEFAAAVGPAAAAVVGSTWAEVADRFGLDDDGRVAAALARRDTWSGRTVLWPIEGEALRLPIDLAALPIFDRGRVFVGFRGFGTCRPEETVPDPTATGLRLAHEAADLPVIAEDAAAGSPADPRPVADAHPASEAHPVAASETDRPATVAEPLDAAHPATAIEVPRPEAIDAPALTPAVTPIVAEAAESEPAPADASPVDPEIAAIVDAPEAVVEETTAEASADAEPTLDPSPAPVPAEPSVDAEPPAAADATPEAEPVAAPLAEPVAEIPTALAEVPAVPPAAPVALAEIAADPDASAPHDVAPAEPAKPATVTPLPLGGFGGIRADESVRLSQPERLAFRQIAEALGSRLDPAHPASEPAAPRAAPAPRPRRAAETPAAANDARLLERLPLAVAIVKDDDVVFANERFLKLLAYPDLETFREEGGLDALFAGSHAARRFEATDAGRPVPLIDRDGVVVPVDAMLATVPWGDGSALMMTLTEFRPPEIAAPVPTPGAAAPAHHSAGLDPLTLQSRVAELEAVVDTATDGVMVLDADGLVLSANHGAEALFGTERSEMIGRPLTDRLAPESRRSVVDYLDGLARNGVASVLNDGREVIGAVQPEGLIPLFLTIGRISVAGTRRWCAVLRDIAQWKKAEEDLTAARRRAEEASLHKSDFLAKISHEIRTPLNAIIGFSEVMMDERFGPVGSERYKDYLRDIHVSGTHIMSLVNDLLDLSKVEAGKMDLRFEAVGLADVVSECVAMMQPQANRNRIIIRTSLPAGVPAVVADPRSVRQVVLNLLSNAVKFTPAGGQVIVSTSLEDNGEVVMRVRDTGYGMTDKELETAMEPFRQLHTTRTRAGGTGLGLPLTKALVEANRAVFRIDSTVGQGTLVSVAFPVTRVLAS
jgi:PAS domain S-box-containing protein